MKCDECGIDLIELGEQIIIVDSRVSARFKDIKVPRTLRFCRIECMLMYIINEQMGNGLASGMGLCYRGEPNRFWIKDLNKEVKK